MYVYPYACLCLYLLMIFPWISESCGLLTPRRYVDLVLFIAIWYLT